MAYYPAPTSYPSILGEMYSAAFALSAFNWDCAPAATELEIHVMDWLGKMLSLPSGYLSGSRGGGMIQGSTSEAILTVMVAARERYLQQTTASLEGSSKTEAMLEKKMKLVALGSEAAHTCTAKAARIIGVRYRSVPVSMDQAFSLTVQGLERVLAECRKEGLEPFFLTATLGTTATCAVDRFDEIRPVVHDSLIWVHVDAAYAGNALVCEEYQYLTREFEAFSSFSMSMSKWLLVNLDAWYAPEQKGQA